MEISTRISTDRDPNVGILPCGDGNGGKNFPTVTLEMGMGIMPPALWGYPPQRYVGNFAYKIDIYYIFNIKIKKI